MDNVKAAKLNNEQFVVTAADEEHGLAKNLEGLSAETGEGYTNFKKNIQPQDGSWAFAFFNLTCSIVGTGALGLPYGVGRMGWGPGIFFLIFGTFVTYYCAWLLAGCSEIGKMRYTCYRDISRAILGDRWTNWFVIPLQFATLFTVLAVCGVLGGQALQSIYLQFNPNGHLTLTAFIWVYGAGQIGLSLVPTMKDLTYTSTLAVLCAMIYSVVAVAGSIRDGVMSDHPPHDYGLPTATVDKLFSFFTGISIMATAFGTACLPEIQGALASPSAPRMRKAITGCWIIIFITYTTIAVTGYYTYGANAYANVLLNLSGPRWAIVLGQLAAVIQTFTSVQVYSNVFFDVPERLLRDGSKGIWAPRNFIIRLLIRVPAQAFMVFLASLLPFLGDFASLLGIGFVMMDFVLPAVFHLVLKKPKALSIMWCADYIIAFIYTVVGILGLIASVRAICIDASTYKVFYNGFAD